jgi:hypothetical protein
MVICDCRVTLILPFLCRIVEHILDTESLHLFWLKRGCHPGNALMPVFRGQRSAAACRTFTVRTLEGQVRDRNLKTPVVPIQMMPCLQSSWTYSCETTAVAPGPPPYGQAGGGSFSEWERLQKKTASQEAKVPKDSPQPQIAPIEGAVAGGDDPPNAGGASSSAAIGHSKPAMPAPEHLANCDCVDCTWASYGDSEDDIVLVVYNQFGSVYDAIIPGQIAQENPPLMRDECPSEFDATKWAVRPAGARKHSIPYFYVNENEDHVDDPLAHLPFALSMKGRSWNFKTQMRPGYYRGLQSKSAPCASAPCSEEPWTPGSLEAISIPAVGGEPGSHLELGGISIARASMSAALASATLANTALSSGDVLPVTSELCSYCTKGLLHGQDLASCENCSGRHHGRHGILNCTIACNGCHKHWCKSCHVDYLGHDCEAHSDSDPYDQRSHQDDASEQEDVSGWSGGRGDSFGRMGRTCCTGHKDRTIESSGIETKISARGSGLCVVAFQLTQDSMFLQSGHVVWILLIWQFHVKAQHNSIMAD